jgi:hypothetical protein
MEENDQVEGLEPEAVEEEDDTQIESELDSDDEQPEEDSEPEEDDEEELEHDGQKYKVPKALKPLLMMQADYTQKTQSLAEQRKAFEAQQAQMQTVLRENVQEVARVMQIDERLQQFQQVNWQALSNQDPLQAQQLWFEFQGLKESRQTTISKMQQNEAQAEQARNEQLSRASAEGHAVLSKELPGWGSEMAAKILDFGVKELGYEADHLKTITDPRIIKTLHAAMIGHQVLSNKATQTKKPTTPATPVKTVGKSAPATKNPERMTTDEWMKSRNQQLRKKQR